VFKRPLSIACLLVALLLCVLPLAHAQTTAAPTLLVKLVNGLSVDQQAAVIARIGGTEVSSIPALRLHVVAVPAAILEAVFAAYQADPQVQHVEVNKTRTSEAVPADPLYTNQWALPKIGWDQVFGVVTPTGSAKVALLDTGVDASHQELAGKVLPGISILDGSNGMTDPSGHGTWLAGIIAAQTDTIPLEGIAGIGYAGVQIVPVTVLNANGDGQDSDVIAGVVWAADQGADVILMAFSAPDFSQNLQDAIDYAWSKGAVVVAAAGNNAVSTPTFPAGDRGVMGVAATDQNDGLAAFSNSGQAVFIAAPGVDIQTIDLQGNYIVLSGTSLSSAYVAGLAAFMKAVDPTLTNGVIVGRIARNADPAGTQDATGNGRINMPRALADTSLEEVQPAGADPVGQGGPFVGPYVAAAASITLTPSFGQSGTSVLVGGSGFNNNATVASITFSGTAGNLATCTVTDKAIDLGCSFTVPSGATAGSHTVTATSDKGDNPTATFSVLVVALSPMSSTYGTATAVAVNGSGFNNNRNVSITFGGGSTTCTTNNTGTLNGCAFATTSTTSASSYIVAVAETSGGNRRNASATFVVNKADQAALSLTVPASITFGNTGTATVTGGSGTGAVSFSHGASTGCSVDVTTGVISVTNASGNCSISASKAGDSNYNGPVSDGPKAVTLNKANQAALSLTVPASITFGNTGTATVTGGSGTGAVSFSHGVSSGCSVDATSGVISVSNASGNCSISASRAGDDNYSGPVSDGPKAVTLNKANQAALTLLGAASPLVYNTTEALSTSGGTTGGAVTYNVTLGSCSIVGVGSDQLQANSGMGTCTVTATMAGNDNYNPVTSAAIVVTLAKANQAALTLLGAASPLVYNTTETLSASGGTTNGAVTFAVTTGSCSIVSGNQLRADSGTGTCKVTATMAGNANYNDVTSPEVTVTLQKANQAALTLLGAASPLVYNTTEMLSTSGGTTSSAVTYNVTLGSCSLVGLGNNQLQANSGTGTCTVTATMAGNDNYNPVTSAAVVVTLQKANQTITFGALTDKALGDPDFNVSASASSGLTVSFAAAGSCTVTGNTVHLTGVGLCTITASQSGDSNYYAALNVPQWFLVKYGFSGFQSPYVLPSHGAFQVKSTVPLKWQYLNNAGNVINSSAASPVVNIAGPYACGGDDSSTPPIIVNDAGNSGYQYDATTNTWQFNWKTAANMAPGCYNISIHSNQSGQDNGPFPIQLRNK
jgi:hypothetical protein